MKNGFLISANFKICNLLCGYPGIHAGAWNTRRGIHKTEVLYKLAQLQPGFILFDLQYPHVDSHSFCKELCAFLPETYILGLANNDHLGKIHAHIQAGLKGLIWAPLIEVELPNALKAIEENWSFISPYYVSQVWSTIPQNDYQANGNTEALTRLTRREKEILSLIANEHTDKEIGKMLSISTRTVESHRENLRTKIGTHKTVGLIKYAIKTGLIIL